MNSMLVLKLSNLNQTPKRKEEEKDLRRLRQKPVIMIFSLPHCRLLLSCAGDGTRARGRGRQIAALIAHRGRGQQNPAAGRAGGVGSEPRVDAGHVERVSAVGQHSDFVPVGEVGQTDGAVGESGGGIGGEGELGEGAEDLLLEALVGLGRRRGRRGRRRGATSAGGEGGGRGESSEPGAAGDGDEAEDAYEGAEEGCEDDDEVGVDGDRVRGGASGCGRRVGGAEEAVASHEREREREGENGVRFVLSERIRRRSSETSITTNNQPRR